jgi:hypothetical protein
MDVARHYLLAEVFCIHVERDRKSTLTGVVDLFGRVHFIINPQETGRSAVNFEITVIEHSLPTLMSWNAELCQRSWNRTIM